MDKKHISQTRLQPKPLSAKRIFRTILFEYHYDKTIPIQLLATVTTNMTYPLGDEEVKSRYQALLIKLLKQYCEHEKTINQKQFCTFFNEMEKQGQDQYLKRISQRLFHRYATHQILDQNGFIRLVSHFGLNPQQAKTSFYSLADLKNQITLHKFMEYTLIYKLKNP